MQKRCPECNHWLNKNELECPICKHKIGDKKMVEKAEFVKAVDVFVSNIDRVTSEIHKKHKNNDTPSGLWWCFGLKGFKDSNVGFAFDTRPVRNIRIIIDGIYIPCVYGMLKDIAIGHGEKCMADVFIDTITDDKFLKDVVTQICFHDLPSELATPLRSENCECGFVHPKEELCPICGLLPGEDLDDAIEYMDLICTPPAIICGDSDSESRKSKVEKMAEHLLRNKKIRDFLIELKHIRLKKQ